MMTPITSVVQWLGLTRDSLVWFWGRLVSGALIVMSMSGLVDLDPYLTAQHQRWLVAGAAIVLWLAGKYDSSPLPGRKKEER